MLSDLEKSRSSFKTTEYQLTVYQHSILKNAFEGKLTEGWRENKKLKTSNETLLEIQEERRSYFETKLNEWEESSQIWLKGNKKERKPIRPRKIKESKSPLFIDSDLPFGIPKEWSWIKNDELSIKITDGEHITPKRTEKGYYLLSARNIQNGYIDYKNVDYVGEDEYRRIRRRCNPEYGDILISCSGSVGRISHVPVDSNFVLVRSVALVKYSKVNLNYKYLEYLYQSPQLQLQITKGIKATAQANLFLGPISNFEIILCSLEEQNKIVEELDRIFSILHNLEILINESLKKIQVLYYSILKKAFEGKLVNQNINDKSISKLLTEIKQEKEKFLEKEREKKKEARTKKKKNMSKKLSIEDILKNSKEPMSTINVWQQSKHYKDIEEFYGELKKIQDTVKEVKKGTESLLSIKT